GLLLGQAEHIAVEGDSGVEVVSFDDDSQLGYSWVHTGSLEAHTDAAALLEGFLHEHGPEPALELEPDLAHAADLCEAEFVVHLDRGIRPLVGDDRDDFPDTGSS